MRLDEDHIGVFLADVAGHGVPAALMTMVICRSLVTKETDAHDYRLVPPAEVLERLNLDLRRRNKHIRFATAVYALVDCRRRVMTLAGAGHPPPLLLRAGAPARELATDGGLLGVFEDESYEQIEVPLECGDRVLFYSDGFEQAFPHRASNAYERKMPTDRYREEFQRLESCRTATEMVSCIEERLDDQRGSLHQIDDLTLLCLHAGPLPQDALEANRHQRSAAA
jgi:sigma-B regulation protein RsbU (phosphoserine phosphatase)